MSTPVLTVANQLTMSRMGLAPLLVVLVLWGEMLWALAMFVVAGVTDLLDGLIARLSGQQTTLGAMLDPVADKILLTSCFVALTWTPGLRASLPAWLTVVTLSRDAIIMVSVAIINLTLGRRVFYPSLLGKLSTLQPARDRGPGPAAERARAGRSPARSTCTWRRSRSRSLPPPTTRTWPPPGERRPLHEGAQRLLSGPPARPARSLRRCWRM